MEIIMDSILEYCSIHRGLEEYQSMQLRSHCPFENALPQLNIASSVCEIETLYRGKRNQYQQQFGKRALSKSSKPAMQYPCLVHIVYALQMIMCAIFLFSGFLMGCPYSISKSLQCGNIAFSARYISLQLQQKTFKKT